MGGPARGNIVRSVHRMEGGKRSRPAGGRRCQVLAVTRHHRLSEVQISVLVEQVRCSRDLTHTKEVTQKCVCADNYFDHLIGVAVSTLRAPSANMISVTVAAKSFLWMATNAACTCTVPSWDWVCIHIIRAIVYFIWAARNRMSYKNCLR